MPFKNSFTYKYHKVHICMSMDKVIERFLGRPRAHSRGLLFVLKGIGNKDYY